MTFSITEDFLDVKCIHSTLHRNMAADLLAAKSSSTHSRTFPTMIILVFYNSSFQSLITFENANIIISKFRRFIFFLKFNKNLAKRITLKYLLPSQQKCSIMTSNILRSCAVRFKCIFLDIHSSNS